MKKLIPVFLLILAVGCQTSATLSTENQIVWIEDNAETAFQQAKAEKKPVLLEFHAPWCIYCGIAEATVFHDPNIVALSQKFIPLRVNVDLKSNTPVVKKFGEFGIPVVIAVDAQGKEFSRVADPSVESLKNILLATLASNQKNPNSKLFYDGLKAAWGNDAKAAIASYRKVLPYFEKNPGWELATVLNYLATEDKDWASAQKFLQLFPDHPDRPFVLLTHAEVQETDFGKYYFRAKAWEELERALKIHPEMELVYWGTKPNLAENLGMKTEREMYREIAVAAEKRARSFAHPYQSKPYWMRAISWNIRGGRPDRGVILARQMIEKYPEEPTFYELLVWAYTEEQDLGLAMETQKKVIEVAGDAAKPGARLDLAELMAKKGEIVEASQMVEEIIAGFSLNQNLMRRESKTLSKAKTQLTEFRQVIDLASN